MRRPRAAGPAQPQPAHALTLLPARPSPPHSPTHRVAALSATGAAWWLGASAAALGAAAVLLRLPFRSAPLTADEGGYAELARLWAHGEPLYRTVWVDRPQGLLLVFRAARGAGLTSTVALRGVAAACAVVIAVSVVAIGKRSGSTWIAVAAGILAVTAGASPFIEGFTLSGELIAGALAAVAIAVFLAGERSGSLAALACAGLVAGAAVTVKQSAFDAALAVGAYILLTRGRAALAPAGVFLAGACLPLVAAYALSGDRHAWVQAVIGYGAHASIARSGAAGRFSHLATSLPAAAKALGPAAVLAAAGWSRAPLLLRLWVVAAFVGVGVGGGFHPHYYEQLAAPLALVAAWGARRLGTWAVVAAVAVVLGFAAPFWPASAARQASAFWPDDPHLRTDAAVASYVKAHTRPGERIYVLWAAADVYYLADRPPAYRYLWLRNVTTTAGGVAGADRVLAGRQAALVVEAQAPAVADPSGRTAALLRREYRRVARVHGVQIWRAVR